MEGSESPHSALAELDPGTALTRAPFGLRQVVEDVAEAAQAEALERFLSLMAYAAPEIPPRLIGSAGPLEQVLLGLVENAVRHTEKGEVVLRALPEDAESVGDTAPPGLRVRFEVCDTGVGFPATLVERFRASPPVAADASSGGLERAAALVARMGGRLGVESSAQGSTVAFSLPFAVVAPDAVSTGAAPEAAAAKAEDGTAGADVPPAADPVRVLVVDDNATHREILVRYLGHGGRAGSGAASGEEALAALRDAAEVGAPFRVTIVDLSMPRMDGFALARAIRRDPELAATCLILLTAFDERGQGELALREGFSAYLTKPVKLDRLQATIDGVLAASTGLGLAEPPAAARQHAPGGANGSA